MRAAGGRHVCEEGKEHEEDDGTPEGVAFGAAAAVVEVQSMNHRELLTCQRPLTLCDKARCGLANTF